jgi:glycerol kinase
VSNSTNKFVLSLDQGTTSSRAIVFDKNGKMIGAAQKEFPELEQYYWKSGLWSPSYFIASCGGTPLHIVKQYIENQ